ncbi:gamma-glutamylcyclotransferase family protein [Variovorax dokdonensis]|uniref:Gamma-glutamylcyclotransferase family protein n=1 Tax=Variovorax dokdonensis TaxID=344883 RepID=A0ABT7N7L3_9BURK|nr:gamma-glutamylcyclotransferase family protein [Variovorax dokdonensis]MDM0043934.1 gamma-glutamylcyclotransferase family protein [Variovorax dokdonensis]
MMHDDSPRPVAATLVFVYGTLRAGGSNDIRRYRPSARLVGSGWIAGTLYHLGGYPGVLLGGPGRVYGEVWQIDQEVEEQLDRLEDVRPDDDGEYRRRTVSVDVGGQELQCTVYEIHPSRAQGRAIIASGDWMAG